MLIPLTPGNGLKGKGVTGPGQQTKIKGIE